MGGSIWNDKSEIRGATATKASKAWPGLNFKLQLTLSQPGGGADYAHHSNMGIVWLKLAAAPLQIDHATVE